MMKKLLLLLTLLCTITLSDAQTTLFKGDMAIIGIDTPQNFPNDDFAFVPFVDLEEGTQIYFTDVAADGDFTLTIAQEGHLLYTAPAGGILAGTVLSYQNNSSDFSVAAGTFNLNDTIGDNVTAYQGPAVGVVSRFLHAVSDGSGSAGSFPTGFNALLKLNEDDGQYIGSRVGGVGSTYFQAINQLSNWSISGSGIKPFDFTPFEFSTDPIVIVNPSLLTEFDYVENNGPSSIQSFVVIGENLTVDLGITVPGFYEISLDSNSGFSNSIILTPNVNGNISETVIYVRLMAGLSANNYNTSISINSTDLPSPVLVSLLGEVNERPSLLITGVFYEDSPGNSPEATGVELYVIKDIADLSFYGLGSVNDPNVNDGIEFTFPNVSASEGDYIYIAVNQNAFTNFFGTSADYIDPVVEIDGGDTILLFYLGDIIDTFGDSTIDGVGTSWDYSDSWAARASETGPDGDVFIESHWTFGGPGAFAGANTNDDAGAARFPIGRYEINWRGRVSTDWNDGDNWSSLAVPTAADNIKITPKTNKPIITTDVETNAIELKDILTITSGSLTANGDVAANNNGAINIASGASLVTLGTISGTNHTYTRNTTFDSSTGQYSVIGSPVSGANTNILGTHVYRYDETAPFGEDGTGRYFRVFNVPMEVGDGFFSAYTGIVTFTGNFNTGNIFEPLVYDDSEGEDVAGYNLVSNPYPSAIDTGVFLNDNDAVAEGVVYIWDDDNPVGTQGTNDDYLIVNVVEAAGSNSNNYEGFIGTAQGFFVKATVAGSLEFNNGQRVTGNNADANFFRTRENSNSVEKGELEIQKVKLSLTRPDIGLYNSIAFGFIEDATEGKDNKYDADKLNGNYNLQFYSYLQDKPMAIQGLPELTEDRIIPLGMIIGEAGDFQINLEKFENIPDDVILQIHDKSDDSYTQINMDTPFKFTSGSVFDENRFNLVITFDSTLGLDDDALTENKLIVLASREKLTIKLTEGFTLPSAKVEVTDILGRSVLNKNIKESFNSVDINHTFATDNIYLVKVKSELGTVVKKILIK